MSGYKTYIVAAVLAAAVFAHSMGWIDDQVFQVIVGLCGAGGLAALRMGVSKTCGGGQ